MKAPPYLPTGPGIVREALTVVAGAFLAAWIVGQFPTARAWVKNQWQS